MRILTPQDGTGGDPQPVTSAEKAQGAPMWLGPLHRGCAGTQGLWRHRFTAWPLSCSELVAGEGQVTMTISLMELWLSPHTERLQQPRALVQKKLNKCQCQWPQRPAKAKWPKGPWMAVVGKVAVLGGTTGYPRETLGWLQPPPRWGEGRRPWEEELATRTLPWESLCSHLFGHARLVRGQGRLAGWRGALTWTLLLDKENVLGTLPQRPMGPDWCFRKTHDGTESRACSAHQGSSLKTTRLPPLAGKYVQAFQVKQRALLARGPVNSTSSLYQISPSKLTRFAGLMLQNGFYFNCSAGNSLFGYSLSKKMKKNLQSSLFAAWRCGHSFSLSFAIIEFSENSRCYYILSLLLYASYLGYPACWNENMEDSCQPGLPFGWMSTLQDQEEALSHLSAEWTPENPGIWDCSGKDCLPFMGRWFVAASAENIT